MILVRRFTARDTWLQALYCATLALEDFRIFTFVKRVASGLNACMLLMNEERAHMNIQATATGPARGLSLAGCELRPFVILRRWN